MPSIAPHVAAWGRRWPRQIPGPMARGATPPWTGGPFLPDVFGPDAKQVVQAAFGADLTADPDSWIWYELVGVQWNEQIAITIGQRDEAPSATTGIQPAEFSCRIYNPNDDYTADNVFSPYWPGVREQTPVRVLLDLGAGESLRFFGYADGWPPEIDASGNGRFVKLSASGITKRSRQGKSQPKSPFARWIFDITDPDDPHPLPVEWWPLTETYGTDRALSGLGDSHQPMLPFIGDHPSGAAISRPRWGGGTLAPWLPSVVSRSGDVGLTIIWAPVSMPLFTDEWVVELSYNSGTDAGGSTVDVNPSYLGGALGWPQLTFDPANRRIQVSLNGEPEVNSTVDMFDSEVHRIRWVVFQDGGNVSWYVQIDNVDIVNSGTTSGAMTLAKISNIALVADAQGGAQLAQGDLTIWYEPTLPSADAVFGFAGETVVDRLRRLCRQDGVHLDVVGESDTLLGPQPTGTFLEIVEDARRAEDGLVLDGLGAGLTLICRTSAYSVPADFTLDSSLSQFDPPRPVHNANGRCNSFTATQSYTGLKATSEITDGDLAINAIGEYDDSATVNLFNAGDLADYAAGRTAVSTRPGIRYPALTVQWMKPVNAALAQRWLETMPYRRLDLDNMSDGGPVHRRMLLRGWTERWNSLQWRADLVLASYEPYAVTVIAAETGDVGEFVGWFDTDDTVVAAPASVGASSISITVNSGPVWSTAADDVLGLSVLIRGIEIDVTAVSGAGPGQTFTVDPATVTKQLWPGDRIRVAHPIVAGR